MCRKACIGGGEGVGGWGEGGGDRMFAIGYKGAKTCDFLFAFQHAGALLKRNLL